MRSNRTRTGVAGTGRIALIAIVLLELVQIASKVDAMPYQRTLRLCSRSLSDALFLVCKDRGFNEPFSYSGEENDEEERRPASTTGPRRGLVQECCHRSCSIEHLESYCKPLPQPSRHEDPASRGNSIGSKPSPSYKIVSLPYSSVKEFQMANENLAANIPEHRTARAPRRKRRKKGRRKYKSQRACGCRRLKRLRKIWRKVSRETVIPKVPAFQVGTTSPEPIDSIVIFPFKSELSLEPVDGNVGPDEEDLYRSR